MPNLILNLTAEKKIKHNINLSSLGRILSTRLKQKTACSAKVNIFLISADKIKTLNRKWRQIDKVTDVLSFGQAVVPGQRIRELGDIFICFRQAGKQAKDHGHSLQLEIEFLADHGLKHLLGIHHDE